MEPISSFAGLRKNEREVRKNLIIDAAIELFEKKSFWDISMRDIAAKAGASASSIYRYFPSRDDLFIEALKIDINHIETLLIERMKTGAGVDDFAIAVVDYCLDNESTFQMMCHFLLRGDETPGVSEKFDNVQIYFLNMFEQVIKKASNKDKKSISKLHIRAFFASLAGVVMTSKSLPGYSEDEKRAYVHKLALLIIRGNSSF
ncbi:MAG: TetR/AcrR family transcriptional regulator [Thermodesulfobacteriota bacterium]|nr:TetR/AcrR family transcriptional regulator [Thermodesulfobacteriota bacterium]